MIRDQFGRVHDYLRISLTERCNMRCTYCMPEEGVRLTPRPGLMSREEVAAIAGVFVSMGVKKIRLTGGEPLLRKDAAGIMEDLSALPAELTLTSNGALADQYIETFRKAGVRSLNISLDTLKKERFAAITRTDFFDRVISNIGLLLAEGFGVKVNAVLMKGVNDDEVADFVEWTRDKALHMRFIEFMPFDGNKWDWSKGVSYGDIMRSVASVYGERVTRIEDRKNDTSKNYRIQGYAGTFAVISSVSNPFCDTCNRIRLTADGKIKNCLFSGAETNLLGPFRKGEDIRPIILENIFRKKAVRAGMSTFADLSSPERNQANRSMILIGG